MEPGSVTITDAVGILFYSQSTERYLFLLRNDTKHPGCWGLPGGKIEPGESIIDAVNRECEEEIGTKPNSFRLIPLEKFTSSDGSFCYHTFYSRIDSEFCPVLNHEHLGYAWIDRGNWPRPMHPGLWSTINLDAIKQKISTLEQSN